jgi:hypothetical protein
MTDFTLTKTLKGVVVSHTHVCLGQNVTLSDLIQAQTDLFQTSSHINLVQAQVPIIGSDHLL